MAFDIKKLDWKEALGWGVAGLGTGILGNYLTDMANQYLAIIPSYELMGYALPHALIGFGVAGYASMYLVTKVLKLTK